MTAFNIRRLHPDILAIDDGTRAWTATVDPDRSVRQIFSGSSRRPIKLTGRDGTRITEAIHDWMWECAEQLPAALDEYANAIADPDGGRGERGNSPRELAARRARALGATYYELQTARRRGEGNAA